MSMQWNNPGMPGTPFSVTGIGEDDYHLKEAEDRYEVYVNGDLVGHKVLLNQVDDVSDVSDFLKSRGFEDFETHAVGDHYDVTVDNPELEQDIKNHLRTYLDIR